MAVPVEALAQANFASISGRVTDPSRAAIVNAEVSVEAKDTGAARTLTTNSEGLFEAVNLLPGGYTVTVKARGFAGLARGITLEVGQKMGLDLPMSVGEQRESLQVVETAEALRTQDAAMGEVVEQRSVMVWRGVWYPSPNLGRGPTLPS